MTAAIAMKPDWIGGQVGYIHHVLGPAPGADGVDMSVFADVVAGARKVSPSAPWAVDVAAMAGLKVTF